MTKKRRCILLCLFAALALLVGGFFLVRAWLRPEVWVSVPSGCSFVLTNAKGETLVMEHGKRSGTMELLDFEGGFSVHRYRVSDSDFFTFQPSSDDISFDVEWGDTFNAFFADQAQKVTVSRDFVLAEGNVTDYSVSAFTTDGSTRRYELSGDEAAWVRLERSESEATVESSSAYAFELRDLYTDEVFAHHDSPDGAKFTLQNPSEN